MKSIFLAITLTLGSSAFATLPDNEPKRYFYALAQTDGNPGEWLFRVAECARLSAAKYKFVRPNCKAEYLHEVCTTPETTEVRNAKTGAKKNFPKILHVFDSKKACDKALSEYAQEER